MSSLTHSQIFGRIRFQVAAKSFFSHKSDVQLVANGDSQIVQMLDRLPAWRYRPTVSYAHIFISFHVAWTTVSHFSTASRTV